MADNFQSGANKGWPDRPAISGRIAQSIYVICALLVLADIFVHKHGPFAVEHWTGFYGLVAFVGTLLLIVGARFLSALLTKEETYYDE